MFALNFADARPAFVAKSANQFDFAELAVMKILDGFAHAGVGTRLRAGLHNSPMRARGFDDFAAFPDIVGNGFLAIHIFASLNGPNCGERMPMVRVAIVTTSRFL